MDLYIFLYNSNLMQHMESNLLIQFLDFLNTEFTLITSKEFLGAHVWLFDNIRPERDN